MEPSLKKTKIGDNPSYQPERIFAPIEHLSPIIRERFDHIIGGVMIKEKDSKMNSPLCCIVHDNLLYITDTYNNRIVIYNRIKGTRIITFGEYGNMNGQFIQPHGIDIMNNKYIVVADTFNNRLQLFEIRDRYFVNSINLGDRPYSVKITNSWIYVTFSDCIKRYDKKFSYLNKFKDNVSIGKFFNPLELCIEEDKLISSHGIVSSEREIYVCDSKNNRICIINVQEEILEKESKDELVKKIMLHKNSDGKYVESSVGYKIKYIGEKEFVCPSGIAVTETEIFIADTYNHRIMVYNKHTCEFVRSFGSWGAKFGELSYPRSICIKDDKIYILDSGNNRISVWHINNMEPYDNLSKIIEREYNNLSRMDSLCDNELHCYQQLLSNNPFFSEPLPVEPSPSEPLPSEPLSNELFPSIPFSSELYLSEPFLIESFPGASFPSAPFPDEPFPDDLFSDELFSGKLFPSEQMHNNKLQDIKQKLTEKYHYSFGNYDTEFIRLDCPTSLAVSDKLIYVCDSNNHCIKIFDKDKILKTYGSLKLSQAHDSIISVYNFLQSCTTDGFKNDSKQLFLSCVPEKILGINGIHGCENNQFCQPCYIMIHEKTIYVADTCNNRIQIFDEKSLYHLQTISNNLKPKIYYNRTKALKYDYCRAVYLKKYPLPQCVRATTEKVFIIDTTQNGVFIMEKNKGTPDGYFIAFDKFATSDEHRKEKYIFNYPRDIIALENGEVYITDSGNSVVKMFKELRKNEYIYVREIGQVTWKGTPLKSSCRLITPVGLAIDGDYIFVTDTSANKIFVYNKDTGEYNRDFGQGELLRPHGIAITDNEIYIADTGKNRIAVWSREFVTQ
jgi:DNA-binding beta-propeller fold protein YncE